MKQIADVKIFALACLIVLTAVIGEPEESAWLDANPNALEILPVEVQIWAG